MKVKFLTLGCKVNQYETQGLKEKFVSLGAQITKEKADIYVVNTCTVTKRADSKCRDAILQAKKENPKAQVAVCGCLAQLNSDFIKKIGVDYIVPQDKKYILPEIVLGVSVNENSNHKENNWSLKITHFSNQRAFVKVQDGCDNFCSYCKIPYLRGRSVSRGKKAIIDEISKVSLKHKEIVLCGANLGLYGKDLTPLSGLEMLVKDILNIPSLGRLRLSSLEPLYASDKLFSLLDNDKLCPHFHFPFQYGDDAILKKMNKKETVALYMNKIYEVRKKNPNTAISCDIIVGFPGETDKSFNNTVDFLKAVKPMRIHVFTFSPRDKTQFENLKIKDTKIIKERYFILNKLARVLASQYINQNLGKSFNIIAERETGGFALGYTDNYMKVYVKGSFKQGEFVRVTLDKFEDGKIYANYTDK